MLTELVIANDSLSRLTPTGAPRGGEANQTLVRPNCTAVRTDLAGRAGDGGVSGSEQSNCPSPCTCCGGSGPGLCLHAVIPARGTLLESLAGTGGGGRHRPSPVPCTEGDAP